MTVRNRTSPWRGDSRAVSIASRPTTPGFPMDRAPRWRYGSALPPHCRPDAMKDHEAADADTSAIAWLNQGNVHHEHQRHSRARRAFETAVRMASVAGDRHTEALALCNL